MKRVLDIGQILPKTIHLQDKTTGIEYVTNDRADCDFSFMGYNLPWHPNRKTDFSIQSIEATIVPGSCIYPEHVLVSIRLYDVIQKLTFLREYYIYPELPAQACRAAISSHTLPFIYWSRRGNLYKNDNQGIAEYPIVDRHYLESCVDSVKLDQAMQSLKTVEFFGRTDYGNHLVTEHDHSIQQSCIHAMGNLLFCSFGNHGLFYLQEAPPSSERRDFEEHDFRIENNTIYSLCWGIQPAEVKPDELLYSYRHVIGMYDGTHSDAIKRIKHYLKIRFPKDEDTDYSVMVNPWGCGKFIKHLNEQFLCDEIKAAREIGATHYQIDAGWESGGLLAGLSKDNYATDSDSWKISPTLFPEGFKNIYDTAKRNGVQLALWIVPSYNQEHRDWQSFTKLIYELYEKYEIKNFKLDGARIKTKKSEDNLEKMLQTLREKSNGEIVFNFDITNGQRGGYFLFLEYGNIFLENRYVCHNWGMVYHPETVLHNLWQLSRYIRPQTLQIEVTDPNIINREYFQKKGIRTPDEYDPEYWAAVTLFANPLIWLAPSKLTSDVREKYRKIINLHLKYRKEIFEGEIFPLPYEPDGKQLTGFQSHNFDGSRGLVVVYRELKAPEGGKLKLSFVDGDEYVFESVNDHGDEIVKKKGQDSIPVSIDRPGWYRLYRYRRL